MAVCTTCGCDTRLLCERCKDGRHICPDIVRPAKWAPPSSSYKSIFEEKRRVDWQTLVIGLVIAIMFLLSVKSAFGQPKEEPFPFPSFADMKRATYWSYPSDMACEQDDAFINMLRYQGEEYAYIELSTLGNRGVLGRFAKDAEQFEMLWFISVNENGVQVHITESPRPGGGACQWLDADPTIVKDKA